MSENFFDPKNLYEETDSRSSVREDSAQPEKLSLGRRLAIKFLRLSQPGRKRALLLTSVYAYIYGKKAFDKETLVKFNEVFKLTKNPEALEFPVRIGEWVWRGTNEIIPMPTGLLRISEIPNQMLNEEEITYIATEISSRVPKWLIYGQIANVSKEIRTVVYHVYNETRPAINLLKEQ